MVSILLLQVGSKSVFFYYLKLIFRVSLMIYNLGIFHSKWQCKALAQE